MKLPNVNSFFKRSVEMPEYYLSLVFDSDHVAGACWQHQKSGDPEMLHGVVRRIDHDTWEERTLAADEIISTFEEKMHTDNMHKVVLGFPLWCLTQNEDIHPSIRSHLKKLLTDLELLPVGFVPVHQAIIHKLKRDEGVPPSTILLQVTRDMITVSLYRVGVRVGSTQFSNSGHIALALEHTLKEFSGSEVLPSRMLLTGIDKPLIDELVVELTKHPWSGRANFLHFPKIERLPSDTAVISVSMVGAQELGKSQSIEQSLETTESQGEDKQTLEMMAHPIEQEAPEEDERDVEEKEEEETDDDIVEDAKRNEEEEEEDDDNGESEREEGQQMSQEELVKESNVQFVDPRSIGFQPHTDIHEVQTKTIHHDTPSPSVEKVIGEVDETQKEGKKQSRVSIQAHIVLLLNAIRRVLPQKRRIVLPVSIIVFCVFVFTGFFFIALEFLPSATVTLKVSAQELTDTSSVIVDPSVTSVQHDAKIIPGIRQELPLTGDKTIPVTGKKKVGDPAKGSVTIYNKTLSSRTFKKGAVLVSNVLQFTLDADVQIASASENLAQSSLSYGKATALVTASQIGTSSNLPAGTEFVFKDVSTSIVSARNDQSLVGGTSRDVTVVSRADYDAVASLVSKDLIEQAKRQLLASSSGSLKLIEATVKSVVSKKEFDEELDQEADTLHGQITVVVSGISYDENDLRSLLGLLFEKAVPAGYVLEKESITTTPNKVQSKKDGQIVFDAVSTAKTVPSIDTKALGTALAGKTIEEAKAYLTGVAGIVEAQFSVNSSLTQNVLPKKADRIAVTMMVQ